MTCKADADCEKWADDNCGHELQALTRPPTAGSGGGPSPHGGFADDGGLLRAGGLPQHAQAEVDPGAALQLLGAAVVAAGARGAERASELGASALLALIETPQQWVAAAVDSISSAARRCGQHVAAKRDSAFLISSRSKYSVAHRESCSVRTHWPVR